MLSKIQTVEIEINSYCNRSCSYCPNSNFNRIEQGDMSHSVYEKILSELALHNFTGVLSLHFYGEPLLSADLNFYLSRSTELIPRAPIYLYTNGTLLDYEAFTMLQCLKVSKIIVTRQEEDFNNPNYVFEHTYNKLSEDEKKSVIYKDFTNLLLTNRGGLVDAGTNNLPSTRKCFIPTTSITFTLNGNVLPCCEDYNQTLSMGNIMSCSLQKIWESEKYQKFRNDLSLGRRDIYSICESCNSYRMFAL